MTKRSFLKSFGVLVSYFLSSRFSSRQAWSEPAIKNDAENHKIYNATTETQNTISRVYLAKNGTPEDNLRTLITFIGGIESYIGANDIVILKPNAQRYNQGMTNTDTMKAFIDLVLDIDGFSGEIIIAENHQYNEDNSRGWNTNEPNGKYNLNELVEHYNHSGHNNVTKYHWRVAGKCSNPLEGNGQGDSRVSGPQDGDGYVWMEDNYYVSPSGRKCLMTYPVFTSSYSGITIDLKNGAWIDGNYLTDRKVRFINFSALNHHTHYAGVSASVKNLMGVVDMTCGFPGDSYPTTYNVHHIGVSRLKHWLYHSHWRIKKLWKGKRFYQLKSLCYRNFHHTGGALGHFIVNVRKPDLNIITADLVGWGDRIDLKRAFRPKALIISEDPVAADYVAAKEVLLPGTPSEKTEISGLLLSRLHDPENQEGPFYKFLLEAHKQGVGNLDPDKINVTTIVL